MRRNQDEWWLGATFYQVYVRSFADSDGDGIGDLDGVRERLGYLDLLGVDALWLTLDPTVELDVTAFDRLVADAHRDGVRVMVDLPDERMVRFWLDRGVDGFHVTDDHAHQLVRQVLDDHPGIVAAGELRPTGDQRPYDLHLGINLRLMLAGFDAVELRTAIDATLDAAAMAGVPPTWTLSNHDSVREATRYGDGPLGTQRARAMALVELGLPGVVYLYNGEELGLPTVPLPGWALPDQYRSDAHVGSRVPLPWQDGEPPFGFSPGTSAWLPMPPEWAKLTVERQLEDADSTLSLYRQAVDLRKTHRAFSGDELEWYGAPAGCFAYRRKGGGLICVLNGCQAAVPLPAGEILLASGPLNDRHLPPNTAAWLVTS
ncbi:alpha-amylase family glycosyl hydrolase [Actinophytocola sp.]|uniref:alpha-amylase family glycosyl hydrolase n=1 Tax=Actinophytocola sp. TaxID=1872138 RepID=UPI002D356E08|nr:alpha-amylase family glycosyl hydrolase [Actinophytocola sp.]HYQ66750.1 alpha-amylase family glycosyl hydrolase [Actinophytocola sp.]